MPIKASREYLDQLEKFEGYKGLLAKHKGTNDPYGMYSDNGVPAWGFGSRNPDIDITDYASARRQLEMDVAKKEKIANSLITRQGLTQGQQDAIIDVFYNLKLPKARRDKFVGLVNSGDDQGFNDWISQFKGAELEKDRNERKRLEKLHPGKKFPKKITELDGLVKRRDWRVAQWTGDGLPIKRPKEKLLPDTDIDFDFDLGTGQDQEENIARVDRPEASQSVPGKKNELDDTISQQDVLEFIPNSIFNKVANEDLPEQQRIDEEKEQQEFEEAELGPEPEEVLFSSDEDKFLKNLPEARRQEILQARGKSKPQEEEDEFQQSTSQLAGARVAAQNVLLDDVVLANKFKRRYNLPLKDAEVLARNEQFKAFDVDQDFKEIAIQYPAIAEFAAKPENFAILGNDFEDLRDIEVAATAIQEKFQSPFPDAAVFPDEGSFSETVGNIEDEKPSDLQLIARSGVMDSVMGFKHLQMLLDLKSRNLGAEELDDMYKVKNETPLLANRREINRLSREFGEVTFQAKQLADAVKSFNPDDVFDILPEIIRLSKESGYLASETLEAIKLMVDDPKAAALVMAQSSINGLVPILGQVMGTAAGSFVAGPVGGRLGGMAGSGIFGALNSFGIRMNELMAQTGYEGNAVGFYSDPERVKAAQAIAKKYAAYMGLFDIVMARFSGNYTSKTFGKLNAAKEAGKGLTKFQAGKALTGSVTKDLTLRFGLEGPQEFVSRATPGPGVPGDPIGEAAGEAILEQVLGFGTAVTGTVTGVAVNEFVSVPAEYYRNMDAKTQIRKKLKTIQSGINAVSNRKALQNMADQYLKSEKAKKFPDQVGEVIDKAANKEDLEAPEISKIDTSIDTKQEDGKMRHSDDDNFLDEAIDQQNKIEQESQDKSTVRLRPSEVEILMEQRGTSIETILAELGPEMVEAYSMARAEDADLELSISDFMRIAAEDKELMDIARLGLSEHNAIEGTQITENPQTFFPDLKIEGEDDTDAKAEEDTETTEEDKKEKKTKKDEEPTGEPGEFRFETERGDEITIGMLELTSRYRSREDKEVMKSIRKGLAKSARKNKKVNRKMLDALTDVQFRHLQWRSLVMGRSVKEMAEAIVFEQGTKKEMGNTLGVVSYRTVDDIVFKIQEDQDVNVFIHELGHTWLYDAMFDWEHIFSIPEQDLTQHQAIYKQAMSDLAELLNLETLHELRFLDHRLDKKGKPVDPEAVEKFDRAHEVFAQTAEKYFMDGKFKNSKVKSVMELFRSWLKPIAKYVGEAYRGKWDAEVVTPKVERIFEGILGVSNKADDMMFDLFPDPMFDLKELFGKDAERYRKAFAKARADAIHEIISNSMNRSFRERQRLIDKAINEIREEVEAEINETLPMILMKKLKARKGAEKISRKSFIEVFGDEEFLNTIPKGIIGGSKKKGLSLHDVIFNEGIESPADFLQLMQEANRFDEKVNQRVEQRIQTEMPVTKTDEEIKQQAIETITKDGGVEKLYLLEMQILFKQADRDARAAGQALILSPETLNRMNMPHLIEEADRLIATTFLKKFNPGKFFREANKEANKAGRLFRSGDLEGALEAKQRQILNTIAYRKAVEAFKQVNRIKLLFKQIKSKPMNQIGERYDFEGFQFAKDMIFAYENRIALPEISREIFREGTETTYTDEWIADIKRRIDDLSGPEGKLNSFVIRGGAQTTNIETFIELGTVVNMVKVAAQNARTVEIDGELVATDKIVRRGRQEVGKRRPNDPKKRSKVSKTRTIGRLRIGNQKMRETLSGMFKSSEEFAASVYAKLYNMVTNGEADFVRDIESAGDKLSGALRTLFKAKNTKGWEKWLRPGLQKAPLILEATELAQFDFLPDAINQLGEKAEKAIIGNEPIYSKELNATFESKEHLLVAILHAYGSESGMKKFLLGGMEDGKPLATINKKTGKVNDQKFRRFVDRMIEEGVLIQEHFDFMQAVWDIFAEHHAGANAAHRKVKGVPFGKIQGTPFKLFGKTYTGGYYPSKASSTFTELKVFDSFSGDPYASVANELYPQTNLNFTKQRKESFKPLDLSLKSIPQVLHFTLQLKHMYAPMNEFGKVLNHPDTRESLEARRPGIYEDVITPWFDRTKNQRYSTQTDKDAVVMKAMNSVARILRKNARREWFFGNFKSAAKQYLGVVQASSKVEWKHLYDGAKTLYTNPTQVENQIRQLSNRMDVRFNANQKRMINSYENIDMTGDPFTEGDEFIDKGTFFLIQYTQNQTDMMVWMGAYQQGKAKGMKDGSSELIGFADNIVEQTQSTAMISARSDLQQQMEFFRLFTDFTTIPLTMYHLNVETWMQNKDEETAIRIRRQLGVAAATMAVPITLMSVMGALFANIIGGERDPEDDEDDFLEQLLKDIALEAIDIGAPLVGRNLIAIASQFTKEPISMRPSPAFDMLGSFRKAGAAIHDITRGVETNPKELANIFTAFTMITGIPTPGAKEAIKIPLLAESQDEREEREERRADQLAEAEERELEEEEE